VNDKRENKARSQHTWTLPDLRMIFILGITSELTRPRESEHLRRIILVEKHSPAARVQISR